jgi:glucose-1-phosphate adenylyltransferase
VHTTGVQRPPPRVDSSALVQDSLLSPACSIRGRVSHSVLGPGVVVEEGAGVKEAVILDDAVVEAEASVCRAILDTEARVGGRASVGAELDPSGDMGADDLVVMGRTASVARGASFGASERLSPGSRA